jgi:MFS family permease
MAQASLVSRLATHRRWGVYFSFKRDVYILLLFTLGKGFQLSIGAVTINLYVDSLFHDSYVVGIVAAMSAIGALVAGVPVGMLADRVGRKPLLVVSGLVTPLTLVATALSTSLPLLIASGIFNGIAASAYWVTNLPMLTENTRADQRVGAMALNNFLLLGVGALGALIGGAVPQLVGAMTHQSASGTVPLRWGVLAAAFVVLLPALPLFWISEPRRSRGRGEAAPADGVQVAPECVVPHEAATIAVASKPVVETEAVEEAERGGIAGLFAGLLVPDVLFTTGEGAVVGLLTIFFAERFFLQPGPLGVLVTVAGLVGGATSLAAPRIVERFGKLRMATTMQYASVPAILAIGFLPLLPLAAVAEFARQILRGLFEPVYAAFAMERVSSRHRGTLSGFYSLTWSVGYSIGPITAGWLQQNVGLSASFVVGAAFVALSATCLRVFFPRG